MLRSGLSEFIIVKSGKLDISGGSSDKGLLEISNVLKFRKEPIDDGKDVKLLLLRISVVKEVSLPMVSDTCRMPQLLKFIYNN